MTKHIRVRSQGERPEDVAAHTPSFLWLLRDFYLDLEEDFGSAGTARDYLETALSLVPGTGSAVEAKNAIRRSIKTLFPDRDCVTLVRPHADERPPQPAAPQATLRPGHLPPTQVLSARSSATRCILQ